MSIKKKIAYVKSQKQTRPHHCHWPGCPIDVPPAMWGCYPHWMMLPRWLRSKVWTAYRPGQEKDMRPSREYLKVAQEVQDWIKENYKCKGCDGAGACEDPDSGHVTCIDCKGSGVRLR